jgi:hypothetical protein
MGAANAVPDVLFDNIPLFKLSHYVKVGYVRNVKNKKIKVNVTKKMKVHQNRRKETRYYVKTNFPKLVY